VISQQGGLCRSSSWTPGCWWCYEKSGEGGGSTGIAKIGRCNGCWHLQRGMPMLSLTPKTATTQILPSWCAGNMNVAQLGGV